MGQKHQCSNCGKLVDEKDNECPKCGLIFVEEDDEKEKSVMKEIKK